MLKNTNLFIVIAFTLYFTIGAYLSITNGISHDQYHEQLNWIVNFEAIKSLFDGENGYEKLLNYTDKYHGIAFHYFSQPIQLLTNDLIGKINNVNNEYAHYISRHLAVFIYLISRNFFLFIVSKIKPVKFSLIAAYFFIISISIWTCSN